MTPLSPPLRRVLLATALTLAACSHPSAWETGTVTLLVSERGPAIAEIVFEKNQLVRVDYKTDDQATRDRLKVRLDGLMREAESEGLFVKYHGPDSWTGDRGSLRGAKPKPGAPQFARAIDHHLSERDFSTRRK